MHVYILDPGFALRNLVRMRIVACKQLMPASAMQRDLACAARHDAFNGNVGGAYTWLPASVKLKATGAKAPHSSRGMKLVSAGTCWAASVIFLPRTMMGMGAGWL